MDTIDHNARIYPQELPSLVEESLMALAGLVVGFRLRRNRARSRYWRETPEGELIPWNPINHDDDARALAALLGVAVVADTDGRTMCRSDRMSVVLAGYYKASSLGLMPPPVVEPID